MDQKKSFLFQNSPNSSLISQTIVCSPKDSVLQRSTDYTEYKHPIKKQLGGKSTDQIVEWKKFDEEKALKNESKISEIQTKIDIYKQDYEDRIFEIRSRLNAAQTINANLENSLKELNIRNEEEKEMAKNLAKDLNKLNCIIKEKNEEITKKDEEITKKDEKITKKDEEIIKKDEKIINLEQTIEMFKINCPDIGKLVNLSFDFEQNLMKK